MAKKVYVVGNWKMYKTAREATDYLETLLPQIEGCKSQVWLAVPYTSIAPAASFAKEAKVVIGAQNMNDAREGAFTGEIAALMLKEAGASFVILGHSERRRVFHESDDFIHRKLIRALQDDLQPILCVGESLKEREEGRMEEVLKEQIVSALQGVPPEDAGRILLAYEPVWAIGTGKTATPSLVSEAHNVCKAILGELFGKRKGNTIPILYGGSVTPENTAALMSQKEVDGVLVGGASLDPDRLAAIIHACEKGEKGK